MGAHRNVALSELNLRGLSINADAGDTTTINVVASDSGVMFINYEVGGDVTYNLPAVADASGKMFWFFNAQNTKSVIVNAPTSTLIMSNTVVANQTTSANTIGECSFVVCDGSKYFMFPISGTWANS